MRYTDYNERYERQKLINPDYVTIDNVSHALYAWPLIVDIKPGETVAPSSWQIMKAPTFADNYELWHYVCDGIHVAYRFIEV